MTIVCIIAVSGNKRDTCIRNSFAFPFFKLAKSVAKLAFHLIYIHTVYAYVCVCVCARDFCVTLCHCVTVCAAHHVRSEFAVRTLVNVCTGIIIHVYICTCILYYIHVRDLVFTYSECISVCVCMEWPRLCCWIYSHDDTFTHSRILLFLFQQSEPLGEKPVKPLRKAFRHRLNHSSDTTAILQVCH